MATTRRQRRQVTGDDWIQRVRRLETEVAGLRLAMRTRGAIEQAKGILAERLGIDPEPPSRSDLRCSRTSAPRPLESQAAGGGEEDARSGARRRESELLRRFRHRTSSFAHSLDNYPN